MSEINTLRLISDTITCENFGIYSEIPPQGFSGYRLIYCLDGTIYANTGNKKLSCRKNQLFLLSPDSKEALFSGRKFRIYCLDFSGIEAESLLEQLKISCGVVYDAQSSVITEALSEIEKEYLLDISLGMGYMMASLITKLLVTVSRHVHNISIMGNRIGINGFSWKKNVATREAGFFHGKNCIKITPNTDVNGLIVLENWDLSEYNIDLRRYRYMQMGYYYETSSERKMNASLRILNFYPNSRTDTNVSIYTPSSADTFYSRLRKNMWTYATFSLSFNATNRKTIDSYQKAVLRQIKINPFGLTDTANLHANDKMYISSVTFYENEPTGAFTAKEAKNISDVLQLMNENFVRSHPIKFYADACFLSTSRFEHWFKQQTGISPKKYINSRRIEYAKIYLSDITANTDIRAVAFQSGFSDPSYFSRLFKKETGLSPTEYVSKLRK